MTEDELRARMKEKIANFDWDAWSRADLQAAFKSETDHLIETIERLNAERDAMTERMIELWHDTGPNMTLYEWLGWTKEEYARYVSPQEEA